MIITKLKIWSVVVGSFVATIAAIGSFTAAWSSLGLPQVVFKTYVDSVEQRLIQKIGNSEQGILELRIDSLKNRHNQVDRDIFDQKQNTKSNDDPDVRWRLHQKEDELKDINNQLDELKRQRK